MKAFSMNPNVIFVFEASPFIGAGHAIRSLVLITCFKNFGWNIQIATTVNTYNYIPELNSFQRLEPEVLSAASPDCDILLIDSYDISEEQERLYKRFAKKIIVIDDLANRRHDCDILIDQTYGRLSTHYQKLVPENCQILAGSDFALIRDSFSSYRSHAIEKREKTTSIKHILISLGGGALQNRLIKNIVKTLINIGYAGSIDIVIGFANTIDECLSEFIDNPNYNINCYINPNIPQLMLDADFAITAAGSTVWERSFLGLPGIIIQIADNQKLIYDTLTKNNIFYSMDNIHALINNPPRNFQTLFQLCDGEGKNRIIKQIEAHHAL